MDFTIMQVSRAQQLLTYKLLVPYSNATFVYPTLAEMLLEAMKRCFEDGRRLY
ncbi:hypothetical protein LQV63_30915 [Paenibacillus profundus]|uniref:Pyridine nucleotide-disulphide oxidoreductase dimerisation domain-containing protein n=1 Tax=Paenibacillus profundus TaxID=1173085 RepID=A0ABS8YPA1_9BACL|nr:hypothetical protein [Paenibacillus profundus]MCE5173641.1 hypothetical protein [Paenibacillus profundus]